jgi:hypothetical protein
MVGNSISYTVAQDENDSWGLIDSRSKLFAYNTTYASREIAETNCTRINERLKAQEALWAGKRFSVVTPIDSWYEIHENGKIHFLGGLLETYRYEEAESVARALNEAYEAGKRA